MNLEVFEPANSKHWDEIVHASKNGTLYHTWEWLKIMEKNSASHLFPLVFFDKSDNKPFGAIPLFLKEKLGLKMLFSPPPGTAVTLGPVLAEKGYKQHKFEMANLDFQARINEFIDKLKASYIFIQTSPGLMDVRPFSWSNYAVSPCYTYTVDLSVDEDKIWSNLTSDIRGDIKSAQKKGIVVKEQSEGVVDYLFESTNLRYSENHLHMTLRKDYLREIFKKFGQSSIKTFVAYFEEEPVTATACVIYRDTVSSWFGTSRPVMKGIDANKLLYWDVILWAKRNNYRYFEIEGANTRHLCTFKSVFDPSLSIYFEIKRMNLWGFLAEKAYFQLKKKSP